MEKLVRASYRILCEQYGAQTMCEFAMECDAGENVFLYGNETVCNAHFETLCGIKKPQDGEIYLTSLDLYHMDERELTQFRRKNIGMIPCDGGMIPEVPMIDQVILPMKLQGADDEFIRNRLREMESDQMPLYNLYNTPQRSSRRKCAYASMMRATISNPKIMIVCGFLDSFTGLDEELIFKELNRLRPKECVLIYLSGAPVPEYVQWTQKIKL